MKKTKLIIHNFKDAYFNLALEEFFLKLNDNNNYIILWQNQNAIIIGRHQNYYREIYEPFVLEKNIQVVRRMSGGGAVYHDLGNINFTFIKNKENNQTYQNFVEPIIKALHSFGVLAKFEGRNDIVVDGAKVSGNAQYSYKDRIMHHGTILFDVNMDVLTKALNPDQTKLNQKGISSIRSRVMNIKEKINQPITVQEFKAGIAKSFYADNVEQFNLTKKMIEEIQELVDKKYSTKDWNILSNPNWVSSTTSCKLEKRFEGGLLGVYLQKYNDNVTQISFYGDFLSSTSLKDFENSLRNKKLNEIKLLIDEANTNALFGSIKKEEIFQVINDCF